MREKPAGGRAHVGPHGSLRSSTRSALEGSIYVPVFRQGSSGMALIRESPINPDAQERANALQKLLKYLISGGNCNFPVESGVRFDECRQIIEICLHGSQVASHTRESVVRNPLRRKLNGLDFEPAAQLYKLTRTGLSQHQAPAQGAWEKFRNAVPQVCS